MKKDPTAGVAAVVAVASRHTLCENPLFNKVHFVGKWCPEDVILVPMCFWTSSIEGTLRTFLRYFSVKQIVTHLTNVNEVFKNYLPLDFGAVRKQFIGKKW